MTAAGKTYEEIAQMVAEQVGSSAAALKSWNVDAFSKSSRINHTEPDVLTAASLFSPAELAAQRCSSCIKAKEVRELLLP